MAARRVTPGGAVTGARLNDENAQSRARASAATGSEDRVAPWQCPMLCHSMTERSTSWCATQGFQFFPDGWGLSIRCGASCARQAVSLSACSRTIPYFMALRDAVARHVQRRGCEQYCCNVLSRNAEEFGGLLKAARFHNVLVHHVPLTLRLPAPDAFVLQHLSACSAESVAGVGNEARRAHCDMEEA